MSTQTATTAHGSGRKRTIDAQEVASRRVLMRVDFNVPLDERGTITDDRRIRLALPSIESVLRRRGRLILMSHLGRPSGKGLEAAWSMRPVAARLEELLPGVAVRFVEADCSSPEAAAAVAALRDGEVLVLENLRFHGGEKEGDAAFAARLAAYGEVYCNEAFGTAHRADASMVGVPQAMAGRPRVAGLLLAREIRFLSETIREARTSGRPFMAVLGGAKVSDKLGAITNLLEIVDSVLVGGAMAYTFLAARGVGVGGSRVETAMYSEAQRISASAGEALHLPRDHVCGRAIAPGTPTQVFERAIPAGWMGLDIGPRTAQEYAACIGGARTIVWNGPMGVFETPPFDAGTRRIAEAIAAATDAGATSVVGGGDTAAAAEALGLAERFSHVSTGGGASLEMLEGKRFRSVDLLDDA
jgi:phosphoglycerate kinase